VDEQERNLRIAETIATDFAWNGQTFLEGQFVALLDGRVVAVATKPDEAIAALRALAPDPQRGMVLEVARPAIDMIRRGT
jgi:hypothetical protein